MNNLIFLLTLITIMSCQQPKLRTLQTKSKKIEYPAAFAKVLEAHGGMDAWNKMHGLSYDMVNGEKYERQIIDLKDRRERIEGENFIVGYDGQNYWVEADTSYKGNPIFYKNLIFYFYAMPFVLADPGINYTTVDPLLFDNVSYPGIRVDYEDGVGISPKDEYYIYYDPATYEMEWLAYTVTYFSKEKSEKLGWIRYDDWQKIEGILLPNSMGWFKSDDMLPTEQRNRRSFNNVKLVDTEMPASTFAKTEGAKIVEE